MNLLQYGKRSSDNLSLEQTQGYLHAINDLYLHILSHTGDFDPSKRNIDAVVLTEAVRDTAKALGEILMEKKKKLSIVSNKISGVNLGGYKVTDFLRAVKDEGAKDI